MPVSIGPMVVPAQRPARRWRGRAAGFLCVFAIGVAAGPPLVEYAYQGVDAGARILEKRAPKLLGSYRPAPLDFAPVGQNAIAAVAPSPAATAPAVPAEAARVPVAQPRPAPARVAAVEPLPDQPAPVQAAPASRGKRSKTVAKPAAAEPAPAPVLAASSRKTGSRKDPFESDDAPAAKREPKPAAEPAPAPAKAEPRKGKSNDSLDSLMSDVPSDGAAKSKGKHSASKDIDAMLKDVQKSDPAPAPKRVEKPADLPQLTSSDIAKAMAGVKTRANACGKRLGQKGVADVKLTVGKDGRVTDSSVGGKIAGSPLAECVDKALRATTFPPNAGLKFDYHIDVH